MSEPLVFHGKDVDSAIEKALLHLQLPKEVIHIEVIHHGKDRPFKLGRSKAKIIVTKKEQTSSSTDSSEWEEWLNNEIKEVDSDATTSHSWTLTNQLAGKAWIKDGHLYFKDSETKKPIISPSKDINIKKNGCIIKEKTYLIHGDDISYELENKTVETKWSIKVDKKEQLVKLKINPGYYIVSFLDDQPPMDHLTIKLSSKKQPNNQLVQKDVYEQLNKMSVIEGIQSHEITKACACIEPETFIIAKGVQPIHGENGDVDFSIDIHENNRVISENPDGTIDFRESIYIPSIEEGVQLGTIKDPTSGMDGISVFGETLESKDGQAVLIRPELVSNILKMKKNLSPWIKEDQV